MVAEEISLSQVGSLNVRINKFIFFIKVADTIELLGSFENQKMLRKFQSRYPENWSDIVLEVKQSVDWCCSKCGFNVFALVMIHLNFLVPKEWH